MMEEIKPTEESKKPSVISEAHEAAEKLRLENERFEANISKLQELKAIEVLGGRSDAGGQELQGEPEISPKDYAERALRGELNDKKE